MDDARYEDALRAMKEIFGDRVKRGPAEEEGPGDEAVLALVSPVSAEEVELLVEAAGRFSVPLAGLGAGTAQEAGAREGSILVRFDLMSGMRFPDSEELWVEAEPGALWL